MSIHNTPNVTNLTDIQQLREECLRLATQNNMMVDARRMDAAEFKRMSDHNSSLLEKADKYDELIYAVSLKHPNETRHETALRYIRQAETSSNAPAQESPEET